MSRDEFVLDTEPVREFVATVTAAIEASASPEQACDAIRADFAALLADDACDAVVAEVGERFRRVLEKSRPARRFAGRHRRREVNQPFRIGGEAAHHLQRRRRVLLANCHAVVQPGGDEALASHVGEVQHVVMLLLGGEGRLGRLADQAVSSILVSDDWAGAIYQISYKKP